MPICERNQVLLLNQLFLEKLYIRYSYLFHLWKSKNELFLRFMNYFKCAQKYDIKAYTTEMKCMPLILPVYDVVNDGTLLGSRFSEIYACRFDAFVTHKIG